MEGLDLFFPPMFVVAIKPGILEPRVPLTYEFLCTEERFPPLLPGYSQSSTCPGLPGNEKQFCECCAGVSVNSEAETGFRVEF